MEALQKEKVGNACKEEKERVRGILEKEKEEK